MREYCQAPLNPHSFISIYSVVEYIVVTLTFGNEDKFITVPMLNKNLTGVGYSYKI